jgi:DNA adenine methylase
MTHFNADDDRLAEMRELSEISATRAALRGQLEDAVPNIDADIDASGLLSWAGSKRRLLPEILARLPRQCRTYHEPFAGSAAVYWAYHLRCSSAVLGDANPDLIGFYKAIQREPVLVEERAHYYARRHSEAWHKEVRRRFNHEPDLLGGPERAAQFLYLNRGSFNKLWRVSQKGHFNVPWNKNPTCHVPSSATFISAWKALKRATVVHADFEHTIALAGPGDVVYADPPYVGTFAQYGADGFNEDAHRRLSEALRAACRRGATVLLSNSDHPKSHAIYGSRADGVSPKVEKVSVYHAVGAKAERRGRKAELLVTYTKE